MLSSETTARVQNASLKSPDGKMTLLQQASLEPLSLWFDECRNPSAQSHDNGDEPPRKRARLSCNEESVDASPVHDEHISISRLVITLNGDGQPEVTIPTASDCIHSSTYDSIEVGLIGVEPSADGHVRLALTGPRTRRSKQAILEILALAPSELTLLQHVAFLGRRSMSRSCKKSGIARSTCRLRRNTSYNGTVFALDMSLSWRNGESAFGQDAIKEDMGLLMYYMPQADMTPPQAWTPQEFYDSVHSPPIDTPIMPLVNTKFIESDLYPFQKRAVQWMLNREATTLKEESPSLLDIDHKGLPTPLSATSVPFSFRVCHDADGRQCFVSHLQGTLATRDRLSDLEEPKGGILAEEMGLGKTVELIALMCLNKRPPVLECPDNLSATGATIIVTPPTILEQWKFELRKHAPHLSIYHYKGISSLSDEKVAIITFQNSDVVLTTYPILGKEVHYAVDPPDRSLRQRNQNTIRKRSPLVQMHWWRCCLDEAQMVESGVSAAATVAALLPRVNAWAVSGTPLRKNVQDLFGLLIFLKFRPFCDSSQIWSRLVEYYRNEFKHLFGRIALRHTKDRVRQELKLPPQRRIVLTVPFTAIEEQNYRTLLSEMADELGCSPDGAPLHAYWDPSSPALTEKMRAWLVRLRQTCLHPQVGGRNRKALGRGAGPLRTVAEVLEVMIDQDETAIRTEGRLSLMSHLLRAHIIANADDDEHRSVKALKIYTTSLRRAEEITVEARAELNKAGAVKESEELSEDESPEQASRMRLRANLRSALEIQHACAFFTGTAYFQIKSNGTLTKPESDEFKRLEEHEILHYEQAKTVRKELLKENTDKAEVLMKNITRRNERDALVGLPSLSSLRNSGGIENRKIMSKLHELSSLFSAQAKLIRDWRAKVVELLLKPLVDKDEGVETTGDEYEDSTKQQDEMYAYFDALRAIVADRSSCLSGQPNPLIDHEMKVLLSEAGEEHGHAPKLTFELVTKRNALKQKQQDFVSLRGLVHEARTVESALEWQSSGHDRAGAELSIVRAIMEYLQSATIAQSKALAQMEKDQELFRATMNQRLEFYRQLQQISDTVAPYKEELDDTLDVEALNAATHKAETQDRVLATLRTKHRFLLHLREESDGEAERICVICQSNFESGVLTICGHQYCKECIQLWWLQHRNCPVCKRHLSVTDFHNITYKPKELRAQEETRSDPLSPNHSMTSPGSTNHQTSIYSNMAKETLSEIKSIDLRGSFGTKIDTLSRHILYLRRADPGAKCIVFSQYRSFLDLLGVAFSQFKIGYSRMGRGGAIDKFKTDPSIECFLLDAKTDSSGLNLVNATHVFLCEPLINTAIELQAIARVHRIGQHRPTTVYMYLISDTVEEAIYEISVARRLAHMQRVVRPQLEDHKGKSRSATPALGEVAIDAANSIEMQQAPMSKLLVQGKGGGELVAQDDLWNCLFGKTGTTAAGMTQRSTAGAKAPSLALQAEVGRHLRAEAAEVRGAAKRDELLRFGGP